MAHARPRKGSARFVGLAVTVAAAACGAVAPRGDAEPGYVAVHNAFASLGLVEVGPLHRGSLREGGEARLALDLGPQCTSIVVLGGDGLRDVDLSVVDPVGTVVGADITHDPQASVRVCVPSAGRYEARVRAASGSGSFLAATWAGGPQGGDASRDEEPPASGAGTCASPIALTEGSLRGNTSRGKDESQGSCANSSSRELVYRMELPRRQRVVIEVEPRFDAVLYVRSESCEDSEAEVACNDDSSDDHRSKVDEVAGPGTYFVFVDGYNDESGPFRMQVTKSDVPSIAEDCQHAPTLTPNVGVSASLASAFDAVQASCGDGTHGPDAVYRLDLAQRARVRVTEHSDDFAPVTHLRRACADDTSEVACSNESLADGDATATLLLEPGGYAVFADGERHEGAGGDYTLLAETAPEHGSGTPGDACDDAIVIAKGGRVEGDTFLARDDVAGHCGGSGGPDVVYRLDVARRTRVSAQVVAEEGKHHLLLSRGCGERSTEVACSDRVNEILSPGAYTLAVDGADAGSFGRFALDVRLRDVGMQEQACRAAPALAVGSTVRGTTDGQDDKWSTTCAGREEIQDSGDRMYRLVVPPGAGRARVRLLLSTPTWDGVLALRKECVDPADEKAARALEVACNNDFEDVHHAKIETSLEPGTYYVLVDGHAKHNGGAFTLTYERPRGP